MHRAQVHGAVRILIAAVLLGAPAVVPWPTVSARSTDPIAHDPTMIRQGAAYYVFITGDSGGPNAYLPIKRSADLIHWDELGPVFSTSPPWIVDTLGVTPRDF